MTLLFQDKGVNLVHIESRPSKKGEDDYEFYVDCDNTKGSLNNVLPELKERSKSLHILSRRRTKSSSRFFFNNLIGSVTQKYQKHQFRVQNDSRSYIYAIVEVDDYAKLWKP